MRTFLDCYPCFVRQALEAARHLGADEIKQKVVLDQVLELLKHIDMSATPPQIGDRVHRLVRRELRADDPYREYKQNATREALELLPRLRTILEQAEDHLETAVRLSIAGNVIDAGVKPSYQLWPTVQRVLTQDFAVQDLDLLRRGLEQASSVLFLADNAGETVFDGLLIETLKRPVVYALKAGPILNDATAEDARMAGLHEVAELIDTGSDAPGTILEQCSNRFRDAFAQAPLVIAKGQANYETLSEADRPVFFLLQAKCPVIARDLDVPVGSIVIRRGGSVEVEGAY